MPALPTRFVPVVVPFAALVRRFCRYHRVLSRAAWSPRAASRVLLGPLVRAYVPTGPVLLGLDDTVERRRGARIRAKSIYRDPTRSSRSHFVKAVGLRWPSVMLRAPMLWARRVWALPFLTALAPSERYSAEHRRRHKTLLVWARQLLREVHRWLPGRTLIAVADSNVAALELLGALRRELTCITRLRLDARLFAPAPPRPPDTVGRPRVKGERRPLLGDVLTDAATPWTRVTIAGGYGEGPRAVDVATGTGVWHHPGLPIIPLRWVLVRDPAGTWASRRSASGARWPSPAPRPSCWPSSPS